MKNNIIPTGLSQAVCGKCGKIILENNSKDWQGNLSKVKIKLKDHYRENHLN